MKLNKKGLLDFLELTLRLFGIAVGMEKRPREGFCYPSVCLFFPFICLYINAALLPPVISFTYLLTFNFMKGNRHYVIKKKASRPVLSNINRM